MTKEENTNKKIFSLYLTKTKKQEVYFPAFFIQKFNVLI